MTDFDNDLRRMKMLRAVLPYIPVSIQKFINIYIGFEELMHAITTIRSGPDLSFTDHMNYDMNKLGNTEEMVQVLRKYCSPEENDMINKFYQFSGMMKNFEKYKDLFQMDMFQPQSGASFFQQSDNNITGNGRKQENDMKPDKNQNQGFQDAASIMKMMSQMNQMMNNPAVDEIFKNL